MVVKLKAGCYAVQRGHLGVLGPFKPWCGLDEFFEVDGVLGVFNEEGFHWLPGRECSSMGLGPNPLVLDPVRKVFDSESSARAWLNRKPLWKRALRWFFTSNSPCVSALYWLILCGLLLANLIACTAPTRAYPHDPRCNEDGVHTHTTNGGPHD